MLLAPCPEPIFSDWNFVLLQLLFRLIPHTAFRDTVAQFFIDNALVSTWFLAAAFYFFWRIVDERTLWRRSRLLALVFVLCLVAIVTLALRPWVGWPAPVLTARFRYLYPEELGADGNPNCFPSHSTFIYLLVALGLWPFNRKFTVLSVIWVLVLISFPRLYVGGHYPVDVAAGIILAFLAAWLASSISRVPWARGLLSRLASRGLWFELLLFLWVFELGEGFRSSFWILGVAARTIRLVL